MKTSPFERVGQRTHDVVLTDQVGKSLRSPFAGERLVAHRAFSVSFSKALRDFASRSRCSEPRGYFASRSVSGKALDRRRRAVYPKGT
jgi:hypothetical protein